MAQRLRGRVTQSATDADAERLTLPESNRVLSPQPQRPRLWGNANAGPNGDGKHTPDVTGRCSRCGSTPDDDDMDGSKGWHSAVKRGARASNWFNNIMGVLLLVLATFVFARTPLPGSAALRSALDSAASVSPFACESSAARPVELESSMPRDQRSLSGLLNPEEPPDLMVTMPADPEKRALAERLVREEKARWKAEWEQGQRLKREAKAKAEAEKRQRQEEERRRKQAQTDARDKQTARREAASQTDVRASDSTASDRSRAAADRARTAREQTNV